MIAAGVLIVVAAGVIGAFGTWWIMRRANTLQLLQTPNERSSHTIPTPSGGGIGFVMGGTVGALIALWAAPWPALLVVALSLILAAVGFADDRSPIPAVIRLTVQAAVALALLACGIASGLFGSSLGLPLPAWLSVALLVVPVVYWINLVNFMDGIDGIAGSEALFMLLAAAGLMLATVPGVVSQPLFWWLSALAAAVAAFLVFNWQPAKIFMGDAGSTYVAFMLAFFAIASAAAGWLTLWQWLILGATFIADASVTLGRRLLRGEQVMQAHRRHAYQVLSRRLGSHSRVTLLYAAINLAWLLPLAWAAGSWSELGWAVTVVAYLPLLLLARFAGAGQATDGGG